MDLEIQHYKFTNLANTQILKEENKKNMVSFNNNKKNPTKSQQFICISHL